MSSKKSYPVFYERKVDPELWKAVQEKSTGNEKEKTLAVDLIRENYWRLPEEVNDVVKRLAQNDQPESVRARIAKIIERIEHNFPVELYFELIEILKSDPNQQIKGIAVAEEKRWGELFSSFSQYLSKANDVYGQFAETLQKAIIPSQEYFKNIGDAISPYVQGIVKTFELPLPSFSTYEPVYKIAEEFNKTISGMIQIYYPENYFKSLVIPKSVPEKTKAADLIQRLASCKKGREGWRQYQGICKEIFMYLFVPPLGEPLDQARTESELHIRDLILQIPYTADGFWAFCRSKYDSVGLLVECKDFEDVSPNDVVVTAKYLKQKGLGCFGVLLAREKPSDQVIKQITSLWRDEGKLIIVLADQTLVDMIKIKEEGKDPEIVLDNLVFELRKQID